MVRRTHHKRRGTRAVGGKRGYKKCIVSVIKRSKFSTAKAARKAFGKAARHCRAKLAGKAVRRKVGRRRKGARKARKGTRKCKYGHRKGSKRCRKTPRR